MSEKFRIAMQKGIMDYGDIIHLKRQSWHYAEESQRRWIEDNLSPDDMHVLMYIDRAPVAYLSIANITCTVDERNAADAFGIGSVCVDLTCRGLGYGKEIVAKANDMIRNRGKTGFLLCKKDLIGFYRLVGWDTISDSISIGVGGRMLDQFCMSYNNRMSICRSIMFNKNF